LIPLFRSFFRYFFFISSKSLSLFPFTFTSIATISVLYNDFLIFLCILYGYQVKIPIMTFTINLHRASIMQAVQAVLSMPV
jgi:hypothetical protein